MRPFAARIAVLHRLLLWSASLVLALWLLSGFLHPLMSWLSPQPTRMQPPALEVELSATAASWNALRATQGQARLIRLVPGPDGPLWQLTDSTEHERRYLDLQGQPLPGGEAAYVRWLAGWYLGESAAITSVQLQTEFDAAYPWVNRLLPVWRVELDGESPRTAWLHTETGTLTSLSDERRQILQSLFRTLHTMDWLDRAEPLRVLLIALAMACGLALVGSGLYLFWRRPGGQGLRRWHRRLGVVVALPLLLMASSGLLHVLVFAGADPARGLVLPDTLPALPEAPAWLSLPGPQQAVALRALDGEVVLGRWPVAARGMQFLRPDGSAMALSSALAATAWRHLGGAAEATLPVSHFSPDYDFRNRRLPAWIAVGTSGERIAIDPLTDQQIDRQDRLRRSESWVFALLHKWQPLAHGLGSPQYRDVLQVAWLALALPLGVLGWRLRRPASRAPASPSPIEKSPS